jgi:hypothetical protein
MSHIVFHQPPAMDTHVKIFYKSNQRAEPLLLLTFIGDGHTTGFTVAGHTFDASKIIIIVNDNILPSTDWTVSDNMWRNNWIAEEKSTIQLNKEQKIYQLYSEHHLYSAPFVLSMNDHAQPMKSLTERLSTALKAQDREYMGINFEDKKVYYIRTES